VKTRFSIYYHTPEQEEYLQKVIKTIPDSTLVTSENLAHLPARLNSETDVVLLEYQEDNPLLDRWIQRATSDSKSPPVFLFLPEVSTEHLRKALRLGVRECLSYPITHELLQEALERLPTFADQGEAGATRMVSFLGCKGGVGTSFVAANVAYLLAKESKEKVLLVDLDLRYGEQSYLFDAQPRYTILDVVENLGNLDSHYLQSVLHICQENLQLLPAPTRIEEAETVTPGQLDKILRFIRLQSGYSWGLVDVGDRIDEITLKPLELSELVILVASPSIPALSNAKKLLELLNLLGLEGTNFEVVLNCWDPKGDLSQEEIDKFLGRKVMATVAASPQVGRSINEGKLLAETSPRHPVCQDLRKVAAFLMGENLKETGFFLWSWMAGLRGRK